MTYSELKRELEEAPSTWIPALTPEHLGRRLTVGGKAYKMDGYRRGRSHWKFWVIRELDGKRVLLSERDTNLFQWI